MPSRDGRRNKHGAALRAALLFLGRVARLTNVNPGTDGSPSLRRPPQLTLKEAIRTPQNSSIMPTDSKAQKDIPIPSSLNSAAAYRQLRDILRAQPWIECDLISVEMQAGKAILRGCVYSTAERAQVDAAARKLAGVTEVDNRVTLIKEQRTQTSGSTSRP